MATRKMRKFADGGETMDEDYTGGQEAPPMSSSAAEEAPAPRAKAAPKIVTKEELAKSGLSLRDYLNKQQGLTRRGEAGAPAAMPSRAGLQDALNTANRAAVAPSPSRSSMMSRMREADKAIKGVREPEVKAKAPAESRLTRGNFDDRDIDPKTLLPRKRSSGASRYAAGGSVSASRRADGIATKGKTRGRMC